ncbi:hypothetical protein SLEP1_g10297 [Rubroshorea leprosula]|uniref:Uncharacterized protein n=1 Tax=Rubroshorea leprosula TaxID=152421 RepID=A0AAV5I7P3_9ROSI|nr:hypothetical protein SLEP1_g10297 [Rubroshorea leprosula]
MTQSRRLSMMVVNPSASSSVPILASIGSCIFFLLLCHFYVLMEGNPSKSAVMAPVAQDIAEMGVDPIVRGDLRNFSYYCRGHDNFSFCCCQFFPFLLLLVQKSATSKNNTTFIASILLSPAPPNPPLIPTVEIMKGGETGNTARNATIASMRRKPRSVYDAGSHYLSVFRNSLVLWILAACMLSMKFALTSVAHLA